MSAKLIQIQAAPKANSAVLKPTSPDLPAGTINFDALPDSAIIRQPALEAVLSVSGSTIWRLSRRGVLKPIRYGERCTGWRCGDVRQYLSSLTSEAA